MPWRGTFPAPPPQTGQEFFDLIRLSSALSADSRVSIDGQNGFGICHYGYLPLRPSEHLRPFAMRTAFPASDYYDRSVTLGLVARRRSRVPRG